MTRTIITCPGIGDSIWVFQKLVNTNEKFNIVMSDGTPQRGGQLKDLLPSIIASHEYRPNLPYKKINENSLHNTKKRWSFMQDNQEFYLSANRHLEQGNRIEKFLPDLPTSYVLPYVTSDDDKIESEILLPEGQKYIGIYTSAYGPQRNWNFWDEHEWFKLIQMIHKVNKKVSFVLIGASWDVDLSSKLMDLMKEAKIPYVDTVGKQLGIVVECMKRFVYAFYFPSGLPIMSETSGGSDSCMFYPKHLSNMIGTWCDPARRASESFKECLFCSPQQIFDWVKDTYRLFDKIKDNGARNMEISKKP